MTTDDFYTVIVISTIHSLYGQFPPDVRFQHTLKCLESVKKNIPNAKILFVDNSCTPIPEDWKNIIEKEVTVFHQMQHNLFSLLANMRVETKSESEANMMYTALELLKRHNLLGKRIFKISGRYQIKDSFSIHDYERPELKNKYTFVVTPMASSEDGWKTKRRTMWLEQALISFTPENVDEFQRIFIGALGTMRRTGDCIEETLFYYVPHDNIVPIKTAHVCGIKADGKETVDH